MEPVKVLVVDDEGDFLNALVTRLELRGYAVQGVSRGDEALESLSREPVDVVVLDLKMPGMDGLTTLREIKKSGADCQVLLLTGHGSVESGMEGVSLGAFAYMVKPVKLDDLVAKIQEAHKWARNNSRAPR